MATEPNSRKKPDEGDKDDILGDDIDEIDLDALLAEDDELVTSSPKKPVMESAPEKNMAGSVIDEGELDLMADDEEAEAETLSADDLLDIEEVSEMPQSARMDSAKNGNAEDAELSSLDEPPGFASREEIPRASVSAAQEAEEEISAFDLLDDEPPAASIAASEPEIDLLADEPMAPAPGLDAEPAETLEVEAEEETAVLAKTEMAAAGDEPAVEEAAVAAGTAKTRKLLGSKAPRGKKGKAAEAAAAEPAPRATKALRRKGKEKPAPEEKVAVSAGSPGRGSIPFVCSECYEEFLISSNYPHDMVSCPECLHVGKKPDADFIRTIHVHKAGERRSLLAAAGCGGLLAVVALALIWMNSPGASPKAPDGTMNMALLGLGGLLTLCLIWLVARFEKNRWEVYF